MKAETGNSEYGHRFVLLWSQFGDGADSDSVYEQLVSRYAEPWRHYHTFRHIAHCLSEFDLAAPLIESAKAVEMALWFHDAIYIPGNRDNERKSADLFSVLGQSRFTKDFERHVRELILITEHVSPPTSQGERYIVDIDLSPFGIPWELCIEDSRRVRKELAMVPDEEYFHTNLKFLRALMCRPYIYHTAYFQNRYEHSARENIGRLIQHIESSGAL